MTGPLSGLRVIEFGNAMAGPYCGMMLADYGAEVVKIERVGVGDDSRLWGPHFYGALASYFASANRNKKSLALDLKSPEGVGIVRRLAGGADILIDNYRLGVLKRAGLDYESLRADNAGLIYCSISGFGTTGPLKDRPANDLFMQAYSGSMSVTGYPDGDPVKMGLSVCDIGAGMLATIGVLMAVNERHRSGRGQRVDTSLLEGQVSMLSYHLTRFFASGEVPRGGGSGGLANPTYRAYKTADRWIVMCCFNNRMWRDLCGALDRLDWIEDARFATPVLRSQNRDLLAEMIAEIMVLRPSAYWLEKFEAANVPSSPINTIDRVVQEEQLKAGEMLVEFELDDLGPMHMGGLPLKMRETPGRLDLHPPRLGEHTRAILGELGMEGGEIDDMAARGIVGLDNGWAVPGTPAAQAAQ